MPKKRKTREQKILTGQREQTVHQTSSSHLSSQATFSLSSLASDKPLTKNTVSKPTAVVVETNEYNYLATDLQKTAFVTCAIVVAEIVIKILFRG
jgi:hypothetical protein